MKPETKTETPQNKEEYAIVLDVLMGSPNSFKDMETIQAIGMNNFTLLELTARQGVILKTGQKVYVGDGKREEIQYIKRAIPAERLSPSAKSELLFALIEIVNEREEEFVNFFNNAGPITIRKHSLELVSGIGKKHLSEILEERYAGPFKNFEEITQRCPYIPNPSKALAQRILNEIEGKDDFKFFIRR